MLSSKDTLVFNLLTLKEARKVLAQNFIEENPEIYRPMFQYEESNEQMMLAKERYVVSWLASHWKLIEAQEIGATIRDEARYRFTEVFLRLLEKFNSDTASPLSIKLIKEKIEYLEDLISLGDKSNNSFNKLLYDYERDKRIFNRKINSLKGK